MLERLMKMEKNDILKQTITLNNGVKMPQFGLGTYLMSNSNETYQAVTCALENGYRHIDTAEYYKNEVVVGQAIIDFLAKNPTVSRKDLFITTKIWNTNHSYEEAKNAIKGCLDRLKVGYLDLCLVHWPTKKRYECWQALTEFYNFGKIKAIGVSNFNVHHLKKFLKKVEIKPAVNQIETHPGFNQTDIIQYCHDHDIVITSWRTIMAGKADCVPLLQTLATKYQTTASHICLRWAWQLNQIVIPKSINPQRIASNPDIGHFALTDAEMTQISQLPQERLGPDPDDKSYWKDMID